MKINRTFGKITGHFGIVFENEQSKINLISSEISWDQWPLKKVDQDAFSFWVNDMFARENLVWHLWTDASTRKIVIKVLRWLTNYQVCIYKNLESDNLNKFVI